jgi:hypothetical protein
MFIYFLFIEILTPKLDIPVLLTEKTMARVGVPVAFNIANNALLTTNF